MSRIMLFILPFAAAALLIGVKEGVATGAGVFIGSMAIIGFIFGFWWLTGAMLR